MVSPLGQRQMFQTMNTEAVRAASEVSGQLQRDAGFRQAIAERMAEEQASVPLIPKTDAMRTEERREGRRQGGREGAPHPDVEAEPDEAQPEPARTADGHLDLLA